MAAYNAAAWLRRRQSHLAVNAIVYFAAVYWEQRRVADHLVPCLAETACDADGPEEPIGDQSKAA